MIMADRIKERRIAMKLTQEELGQRLGLQKSAIAKYENGRVENIKRSVIQRMAEVLSCSPCYLMGWEDPTSSLQRTLTPDESDLLDDYSLLNDLGKKKARDDVSDLTEIPRYRIEEPDYLQPVAAHDREDILVSEDMVDADNVLMKKLEEKRKQQDKK